MEKTQIFVATLASKKLPIGEAVPKKTKLCTPPPPRLDKRQAFPLILVAMKTAWDRLIRLPWSLRVLFIRTKICTQKKEGGLLDRDYRKKQKAYMVFYNGEFFLNGF